MMGTSLVWFLFVKYDGLSLFNMTDKSVICFTVDVMIKKLKFLLLLFIIRLSNNICIAFKQCFNTVQTLSEYYSFLLW